MSKSEFTVPQTLALACDAKKAGEIKILDLRGKSDLCDFQVICSGATDRQAQAIAQEVVRVAKKDLGLRPSNIEGLQAGLWVLIDLGGTMVHVFQSETRNYYALDQLWPEAKVVPFSRES